jgi:peroxiredoxin
MSPAGFATPLVAALALATAACGGREPATQKNAAEPRLLWERPGLAGAIRPEMGRPQPGDRAPDFELPIVGGGTLRLDSLRGSWVLMHFTATWCPFCDAEVEHLGELAEAYPAVRVLLVDIKEDVPHFTAYAQERIASSVTPLYDAAGDVATRYAPPRAQPSFTDRAQVMFDTTLLVDPNGILRLFLFPDSAHFDPTFRGVRDELDRLFGRIEHPVAVAASAPRALVPETEGALVVNVAVLPDYHLMSDRPSRTNYIATEVRVDSSDGLTVQAPRYPSPVAFDLGGRPIATFNGNIDVIVPLRAEPSAAVGARVLRGSVRYQACTRSRCLAPAALPFQTTVRIDAVPTR